VDAIVSEVDPHAIEPHVCQAGREISDVVGCVARDWDSALRMKASDGVSPWSEIAIEPCALLKFRL